MSRRKRLRVLATSRKTSIRDSAPISDGRVEGLILLLRGERVILDSDLAALYAVPTKRLNEQVKRNIGRFPDDFMFQLTADESSALRSQIATSYIQRASSKSQIATLKLGRGGRRYAPYVFTEHGAIMAANVLNSTRAVQTSVFVVRAFVRLRRCSFSTRNWRPGLTNLNGNSRSMTMRSLRSWMRSVNSWLRRRSRRENQSDIRRRLTDERGKGQDRPRVAWASCP